jgi:6-phosphofructokinase 1
MNAAVRSVTRTALFNGVNVVGIKRGFAGLLSNDMEDLTLRSVSNKLQAGGTFLYTARSAEFNSEAGIAKAKANCIAAGIDGLVICGGDGSFRGAGALSLAGIPCVGIPCTIDNDIACTEYTIGFDTAVNTVTQIMDKLRDTSQSHDRCSVIEVMGRRCGDIAMRAAICGGAVSALIPEIEFDLDRDVVARMRKTLDTGKNHFIVIVAEGVVKDYMTAGAIARYIEHKTKIESRDTVIGHIQRGGSPTARDRVVPSQMGYHAVQLLLNGMGGRVVALHDDKVVDYDIVEAMGMKKEVDMNLFKMMQEISI